MSEDKPRDLIDLQRIAADEGREQSLRARMDLLQLVTFVRNTEPGRSDPLGRHPSNGRPVFPDRRRQGGDIKVGETWFCELEEYRPNQGGVVYYGNPVVKVDSSYLFDLRPEQVDQLVSALQRTSQSTLLDLARKEIREELERSAKAQLETIQQERDTARAEADRLHAEVSRLTELNQLQRRQIEGLSLTRQAEVRTNTGTVLPLKSVSPDQSAPIGWFPLATEDGGSVTLERPLANVVISPSLKDGRYFAHVSPDRRTLLIRWHKEGNLIATARRLEIPGLEVLRPFDRPEMLRATYDPRAGGLIVSLREGA